MHEFSLTHAEDEGPYPCILNILHYLSIEDTFVKKMNENETHLLHLSQ